MELSNDIPSMKNIYDSTYWNQVKQDEQQRGNKMFNMAEARNTGIVAMPATSDMFKNMNYTIPNNSKSPEYVQSLTGNKINRDTFIHNNMTPFLRKNVTQNTNIETMSPFLDSRTGNNQFWQTKKEVPCMFKPQANIGGNICGMKNNDDFYKSRLEFKEKANNFFPIEQVKVGPGLNKGYDSKGVGGFHQTETNTLARPKNLDELRSKINQKQSYFNIPVKGHIKGTDQRGVQMPLDKNRPDTVYEQSEDMWIKTTGANSKNSLRPAQNIRPTTRQESHIDYKGGVSISDANAGISDDYGKSKVIVYNNERATTENKPVVSNVTSIVKAIVSPVVDALKYTMKEYTVESERGVGNPSIQIPEKATTYDPDNHIMKTTVKETTIHDSEMINLSGNKETYSTLTDQAKTTVKETLIHDSVHTNIKAGDGGYTTADDEAKTTIRETVKAVDTVRNIGGVTYSVSVYDPEIVAKTTVKETTLIAKSPYGFLGGMLEGLFGGYISKEIDLKNTHKQFLSDTNEYGIAGATNEYRQRDRTAEENAEIDDTRERIMIAAGHTPNPGNMNINRDSADVEMTTRKPFENSASARENGNVGMIYQSSPTIDECGITKMPQKSNAYTNRLDSDLLEPVNDNDLMKTQRINPIKSGCKL
jgi:hypothetical protein